MKKAIFTFLILVLTSKLVFSQWQETNATNAHNESCYHITEHNNQLFAAVNSKGLIKWNNGTWDSIPVYSTFGINANSIHIAFLASSGNSLYAIVAHQSCASSMIYRSDDDGVTFTADTAGLPKFTCDNRAAAIHNVFVLSNKLFIITGTGNYSKYPNDASWVKNTDSHITFAETWAEYNDIWFAYDGYKMHKSTDFGASWVTPANTNLPPQFLGKILNVNPNGGRVYVFGRPLVNYNYKFLFTDDQGDTWDSIPMVNYLGTDWIGNSQTIVDMISDGDFLELSLINNGNNSHPDFLTSDNGGQTFTVDTVGLDPQAFGTSRSAKMQFFDNELFLVMNFNDIYKKGITPMSIIDVNVRENDVYLFPNPFDQIVTLGSNSDIIRVDIIDLSGKIILSTNTSSNHFQVDLSHLAKGTYLLNAFNMDGSCTTKKIIKY